MTYRDINDMVREKHYTCQDCGADFVSDPRAHPMRCPTCREAIARERKRAIDREAYQRRKRDAGSDRYPGHPLDLLAVKIIKNAMIDAIKQYGYDLHPVSDVVRDDARKWLRTTGAEWLEVMGVDARLVIQRLAADPCMEQGEL